MTRASTTPLSRTARAAAGVIAALSLLASLASAAMGVRSRSVGDQVSLCWGRFSGRDNVQRGYILTSGKGLGTLTWYTRGTFGMPDPMLARVPARIERGLDARSPTLRHSSCPLDEIDVKWSDTRGVWLDAWGFRTRRFADAPHEVEGVTFTRTSHGVCVPYWALCLLFALPPALWLRGHLRRRRVARRQRLGLCVRCGYDLRSGPEASSPPRARCPECGHEPPAALPQADAPDPPPPA